MPNVNLPPKVRLYIYITTGIGDLVVAYLVARSFIGSPESVLWLGLSGFVKGLAALNVSASDGR